MQTPGAASQTALKAHASEAKDWLFNAALPLWWEAGFDRASQCFVEALSPEGRPLAIVRRVRVQARQTFVYVAAGRLGWNGPWRDAANAGAEVLIKQALREDGGCADSGNRKRRQRGAVHQARWHGQRRGGGGRTGN